MRHPAFVLVLALQLGCAGSWAPRATGASDPGPVDPGTKAVEQSLELRLDQAASADGLTLTWISVSDSRCPRGVTCIWAGEVTLKIRARDGAEESELTLTLGAREGGDRATTARHGIRLTAVGPAPSAGAAAPRDAHRATVLITPR